MSDTTSSYGDPVDEPRHVDGDVVGQAEAGLADAEAAGREAVNEPAPEEPVVEERVVEERVVEEPVAAAPVETVPDDADEVTTAADYEAAFGRNAAETEVVAPVTPVVTPSEPVADVPAAVVAPAAVAPAVHPIFVQAPEAPRPRGNRAAAGAIGVVAALSFAVLYLAAMLGFGALTGDVTLDNAGEVLIGALGTASLWVTVLVFFLSFWLLGAIINRGRWGAWVVFGLLVGFASYGGHILGQLVQAPFWSLTASEGAQLIQDQLYAPLAIAAFIIGRELTIWFGAWAASRGRRVTELNLEAQREYERTLEAGPQLVRQ
jgi:hypothetical protein